MGDRHLSRYGAFVTPGELRERVRTFRAADEIVAGLVLPWDRPASEDDLDLDPAATTAGALWSRHAECSWRLEGEHGVITILADHDLGRDELPLETVVCERDDLPPVLWGHRQPFSRGADVNQMHPRRYLVDGVPEHQRLVAR